MNCKHCGSDKLISKGNNNSKTRNYKDYKCKACGRRSLFPEEKTQEKSITMGLTEQEIRSKHDAAFKIRKTAEALRGDLFFPEYDFLKMCNLPAGGYRYLIDNGQFDQYRGKAGNTTYWSSPESIKRLKDEGVLK